MEGRGDFYIFAIRAQISIPSGKSHATPVKYIIRGEGTVSSLLIYSVIQSERNSFCGDVVLDSVDMAFWDEDNILDRVHYTIINNYIQNCIMYDF